ncbi:MAG TPA: DUF932 domain-containing protein [Planctomycetota bacterium]|jgi:hypothetical protein
MLMLSHAHEVSRRDLSAIPTPDPTDTWRPVAHADVVDTLTERAAARGLTIKSERYAVLNGTMYPRPGMAVELRGAKLFGTMDFASIPGMPFPAGCTPSAGIRNSHDKSFALSILSGARVFVCANGVLSAEHIVARKHTSGMDLPHAIDLALDAFMQSIRAFNATYERLRAWQLRRTTAHSLIVELARAGAFSSSDIVPVVEEFEQPRHLEFVERNAWSLYQSATEIMKHQSPARQVDGFHALNKVLVAAVS